MNFNYQKELVQIWEKAVKLYQKGNTEAENFPISDDLPFLNNIGLNKMDIFDYVEDWICEGTPDLATFLLIHDIRRDFFIEEQKGIHSKKSCVQKIYLERMRKLKGSSGFQELFPKQGPNFVANFPLKLCFAAEEIGHFCKKTIFIP